MRNGTARPAVTSIRGGRIRKPTDSVTKPQTRAGAWGERLARQTQDHPGRSVALALGAGFLLGGGLFSPLTVRILGAGMRLGLRMALPLVTQSLLQSLLALGQGPLTRNADLPRDPDDDHAGRARSRSENTSNQRPSVSKEK